MCCDSSLSDSTVQNQDKSVPCYSALIPQLKKRKISGNTCTQRTVGPRGTPVSFYLFLIVNICWLLKHCQNVWKQHFNTCKLQNYWFQTSQTSRVSQTKFEYENLKISVFEATRNPTLLHLFLTHPNISLMLKQRFYSDLTPAWRSIIIMQHNMTEISVISRISGILNIHFNSLSGPSLAI